MPCTVTGESWGPNRRLWTRTRLHSLRCTPCYGGRWRLCNPTCNETLQSSAQPSSSAQHRSTPFTWPFSAALCIARERWLQTPWPEETREKMGGKNFSCWEVRCSKKTAVLLLNHVCQDNLPPGLCSGSTPVHVSTKVMLTRGGLVMQKWWKSAQVMFFSLSPISIFFCSRV